MRGQRECGRAPASTLTQNRDNRTATRNPLAARAYPLSPRFGRSAIDKIRVSRAKKKNNNKIKKYVRTDETFDVSVYDSFFR